MWHCPHCQPAHLIHWLHEDCDTGVHTELSANTVSSRKLSAVVYSVSQVNSGAMTFIILIKQNQTRMLRRYMSRVHTDAVISLPDHPDVSANQLVEAAPMCSPNLQTALLRISSLQAIGTEQRCELHGPKAALHNICHKSI